MSATLRKKLSNKGQKASAPSVGAFCAAPVKEALGKRTLHQPKGGYPLFQELEAGHFGKPVPGTLARDCATCLFDIVLRLPARAYCRRSRRMPELMCCERAANGTSSRRPRDASGGGTASTGRKCPQMVNKTYIFSLCRPSIWVGQLRPAWFGLEADGVNGRAATLTPVLRQKPVAFIGSQLFFRKSMALKSRAPCSSSAGQKT